MKQVIAYIKPSAIELVTEGLRNVDGLTGMSVVDIRGFGRGRGTFPSLINSQITPLGRNVRLEIMVSDAVVWEVVDTIRQQAWSGDKGEGKIYVLDIVEAVRIRTNERGEVAV
ncbi:MAG: P-II family nitrogen regulator [Geobacteraceae bacterium]|nr:P-II family nitrogen regulator [Geobacteraceae bacterium]